MAVPIANNFIDVNGRVINFLGFTSCPILIVILVDISVILSEAKNPKAEILRVAQDDIWPSHSE